MKFDGPITFNRTIAARKGWYRLGNGLYSSVYGNAKYPDVALKVGTADGWPDYMIWANGQGYGGNLAPKLFALHFHDTHSPFYTALIERLPLTVQAACEITNFKDRALAEYRAVQKLAWPDSAYYNIVKVCPDLTQRWAEFIPALKKEAFGYFDLHGTNMMIRDDGSLVMTDPVACIDGRRYCRFSGRYSHSKGRTHATA